MEIINRQGRQISQEETYRAPVPSMQQRLYEDIGRRSGVEVVEIETFVEKGIRFYEHPLSGPVVVMPGYAAIELRAPNRTSFDLFRTNLAEELKNNPPLTHT